MNRPVAPHTGAWIETLLFGIVNVEGEVAPHTGAWIETVSALIQPTSRTVAPHTGAWIETDLIVESGNTYKSPPIRGRGLKLGQNLRVGQPMSPPIRGRGLKHLRRHDGHSIRSRPPYGGVD